MVKVFHVRAPWDGNSFQSQEEANQATAASKKAAKGARKRSSSVPPGSDTAKAKQAKAQADAKEKKPVVER